MWTSPHREKGAYSSTQKILPTNEDVNVSLHHLTLKAEYEPLRVLHLHLLQDLLD